MARPAPAKVLLEVGKAVRDEILPLIADARLNLFLIGADARKPNTLRAQLNEFFSAVPWINQYQVLYPEDLFSELTYERKYDLLELENLLASAVHGVVVCVESPGAYAELGAFSNHEALIKRLIVVSDRKYKHSKSFLRLGPIRHIELMGGTVIWYDPRQGISWLASQVRKAARSKRAPPITMTNPVVAESFVLPFLFLAGPLSRTELESVVASLDSAAGDKAVIACSSALTVLFKQRAVSSNGHLYSVTRVGVERILTATKKRSFLIRKRLDDLRVVVLNYRLRREVWRLGGEAASS